MMPRLYCPPRKMNRPGAGGARAVLLVLGVILGASSCTTVGAPGPPVQPETSGAPSILQGEISDEEAREASFLLGAARDSLALGLPSPALDLAQEVIRRFPRAPGSSEALWVAARAAGALGREGEAADAGERYAELLSSSSPGYPDVLLFVAGAWTAAGNPGTAVDALLRLPAASPVPVLRDGLQLLRDLAPELTPRDLVLLLDRAPRSSPLYGPAAALTAAGLYQYGERAEAERWAEVARGSALEPPEEDLVQGVLGGTLEETRRRPVVVGAILPRSGVSPGLQQYAEWIYEGIQVAVAEFQPDLPQPVEIELVDDQGDPEGSRASIRSLEAGGALAVLGPVTQAALAEAAASRGEALPVISPSAFLPPEESPGVLSLSGPNPAAAELVARYAWDLGLEQVVVLRPRTEEAREDASAFMAQFGSLGGRVPQEIVYDSGATFFQAQFDEVASLLPDGLFLPLEPRDIEVLAPQFTFYGLDTLGIQVLGTSGWTDDAVVLEVDSRHTDGVIASTTRLSQDDSEALQRFRAGYERLFQKTLRSDVPALGYDAAGLVLTALRARPATSAELLLAMEEIRDFPGATGRLSVVNGRIIREPHLVRIQNHELINISRGFNE